MVLTIGKEPWRVRIVAALVVALSCTGAGGTRPTGSQNVAGRHARPELQRILDGLVNGPNRIAPGVAAFVSGPTGVWTGVSGVANVRTGEPVRLKSRFRLASVSKAWTATLILQLAEQHKLALGDTVDRWLPGLFSNGKQMTVRQLLNHTSGMIDSNDILNHPDRYLNELKDARLRSKFIQISARLAKEPGYEFSPWRWVEFAAAIPPLLKPGSYYHYSNIGYDVAGIIAARAGGADLGVLSRRQIVQPLRLTTAAYDPHSLITGPHAHGYSVAENGQLTDTTTWTKGIGASGSMISDAADEARFLQSLMRGKLLPPAALTAMKNGNGNRYGLGIGVNNSGCGGIAYGHNGGLDGYETNVFVSGNGDRVAVLLLNGRTLSQSGDITAFKSMNRLYCAA